ncbi:MAG: IgA Peptidase M64 [Prolixibacteraceae bacterium]|nr:IgA Peptidase M64 [Prolixibacteraceae bacterium]
MKKIAFFLLISSAFWGNPLLAQVQFTDFFTDKTLRYDFILAGNAAETHVYPQQMIQESQWAGSKKTLTGGPDYGTYRYRVFDEATDKLIFSRGFSTLFQEWQTTADAKENDKAFYQAVFIPFPKQKIRLSIEVRKFESGFEQIFTDIIDPENYFIRKEAPVQRDVTYIVQSGEPSKNVDLIFLSEGYSLGEREKFIADVRRMTEYIFKVEPYVNNRNKFNIGALWIPSQESGTDIPGRNIYKNTAFNSTFYTFDVDRYLTTSDMRNIYDALSGIPWEHIFVLVNSAEYGGGGFYNFLGVGTSDHSLSEKVMVHEFGHSFVGLADEYYDSEVAYEDFYNLKTEPWEPNITTLVDFDSKWKKMVSKGVPIPTPRTDEYKDKTGVFEGGGYMNKGIYSPVMDCRMKSNTPEVFCPVCRAAIQKIIDLHCD